MKYDKLIDELIQLNISNRNRMKEYVKSVSAIMWASEFCTVSCDIGRGMGKTTYIRLHATLNDLIIVYNQSAAIELRQQYYFTKNTYTIQEFLDGKTRGRAFENVYVDNASIVLKNIEDKRKFYKQCILDNKEHTFILLG